MACVQWRITNGANLSTVFHGVCQMALVPGDMHDDCFFCTTAFVRWLFSDGMSLMASFQRCASNGVRPMACVQWRITNGANLSTVFHGVCQMALVPGDMHDDCFFCTTAFVRWLFSDGMSLMASFQRCASNGVRPMAYY